MIKGRMTEAKAARIEREIEALRSRDRHAEADRLQDQYWDACNLAPATRAALEAGRLRLSRHAV